ncbi:hypothetical protein FHX37_3776 [Haloactinospora alba]|uniref:Uncharacterized protein n=1 Tax=Haloactinospora alba TaxID=405555 RepID=A0A543N9D9_9ACTN|nr:hypothetical protein [Haloactinospora alba]TQN28431.1 hypothetical protein FHX37_3776 [Haloactinospora alba]
MPETTLTPAAVPAVHTTTEPAPRTLVPRQRSAHDSPCVGCDHTTCRQQRSLCQPRLYGRTVEFVAEHRTAAAIQAHHPGVVVWFGEATQSYWAATPAGLISAPDADTLLLALWTHTTPQQSRP